MPGSLKINKIRLLILWASLGSFSANSQLRIAAIFSDNMVLQREQPVHVWGKAVPAARVVVHFGSLIQSAVTDIDSNWSVYFKKQKADVHPRSIIISSGDQKIEFKNILVGDLWVCIGQSNMEFPMSREMHFKQALLQARDPLLRYYNPDYTGKNIYGAVYTDSIMARLSISGFYQGQWQEADSSSLKKISAVAFYFGKELVRSENIPVGLIHLAIGGAPLESFINADVLKKSDRFAGKINGNWLFNDQLPVWIRERGRQNLADKQTNSPDQAGPDHAYKPGFAYKAGIQPLLPLPVKGLLVYQGESNAQEQPRVDEYGQLFKLMVEDYRREWKQPGLPVYFVQLSSIDTARYKGQLWMNFRDEQRKILDSVDNTGMAVSSDIGARNDVHPTNKKDVGIRLARWALNRTYKRNIIPSGPLPIKAVYNKDTVIVRFKHVGTALHTSDNGTLRGFSLDGTTEVTAVIKNHQVIINTNRRPDYLYYAWKPFPDANLVNSEGLPASTFKIKVY